MRKLTIETAEKILKKLGSDPESFHITFDDILEEKLKELDPEFMKKMDELYNKYCGSRWYA